MVSAPVRHVRAVVNVHPSETGQAGETAMSERASATAEVTKPVKAPKKGEETKTGPRPVVVKGQKAPRPERPAREALTKDQRQKVKFLIQRPDERRLVDKVLKLALEAGTLSAEENDLAHALLKRSAARQW